MRTVCPRSGVPLPRSVCESARGHRRPDPRHVSVSAMEAAPELPLGLWSLLLPGEPERLDPSQEGKIMKPWLLNLG